MLAPAFQTENLLSEEQNNHGTCATFSQKNPLLFPEETVMKAFSKVVQESPSKNPESHSATQSYLSPEIKYFEEALIDFPKVNQPRLYQATSLQKWEGYVLSIFDESFLARLIDQKNNDSDEEAEFSFDVVSEEDKHLIVEGAVFYWNIGYININGQRINDSSIRFRRLPNWTKHELAAKQKEAQDIIRSLNWGNSDDSSH